MGDQKFKELLLSVIDVGQHYEIDAYTFFAIASRIHGQTLNWFANQWAYNDCDLEIFAHVKNIEKKKNGWKVAFVAYHSGTAIPGAPLLYLLETVSETIMIEVQPHLTGTLKEVCVPDRPVALRPDPECEWYASRHSLPLAQYC